MARHVRPVPRLTRTELLAEPGSDDQIIVVIVIALFDLYIDATVERWAVGRCPDRPAPRGVDHPHVRIGGSEIARPSLLHPIDTGHLLSQEAPVHPTGVAVVGLTPTSPTERSNPVKPMASQPSQTSFVHFKPSR
jgi:hypothetical protein